MLNKHHSVAKSKYMADGSIRNLPTVSRGLAWASGVLCLGVLMIVMDATIVNVALPSIQANLGFSPARLVWVVNAYMLTYGGCLLLSGRAADCFDRRRLFLSGLGLFTAASAVCGLANSQQLLIAARAAQGSGGAVVTTVALALLTDMCADRSDRAKVMGLYGCVCSAGGSLGLLMGGVLTSALGWRWIFLINVPVGVAVCGLCVRLIPGERRRPWTKDFDITGALALTAASTLCVYCVVNGAGTNWSSTGTLPSLAGATFCLIVFLTIESRARSPLIPLRHLGPNLIVASVIAALWSAAVVTWFFISALYMQLVLGYGAGHVGLAFLPTYVLTALFSLVFSAKLVVHLGVRTPLITGIAIVATGLALFARATTSAADAVDVLLGMVLIGVGSGLSFNPLLLAAMSGAPRGASGLASGLVNTSLMMGGALGLAILAGLAAAHTSTLIAGGVAHSTSLNAGYHLAFVSGSVLTSTAALIGLALPRGSNPEGLTEPGLPD
jgi:EmrB/QacA subfamily drug resistance transporter